MILPRSGSDYHDIRRCRLNRKKLLRNLFSSEINDILVTMKEIVGLTSLRGIAATLVVIYHLAPRICDGIRCEGELPFVSNGQLMVDFFFMLSGFILAHAYTTDQWTAGKWSDVRAFFLRRIARVYPAHLFMLVVFLAYEFVDVTLHTLIPSIDDGVSFVGSTSVESIFTNLILIHSWGIHETLTWNQPSWSISAELAAYLLFPVLAWHSPIRRVPGFALAAASISFAILAAIEWNTGHLTGGHRLGVLVCVAEFVIGMVLYYWISPFRSTGDTKLGTIQFATLIGIIAIMTLNLPHILLIPFFGLLIVSCRDDKGWISQILGLPTLLWLGRISYSLYITHYIFIRIFDAPWHHLFPEISGFGEAWNLVVVVVEAFMIIGLAYLTYTFVEMPGRNWIQKAAKVRGSK